MGNQPKMNQHLAAVFEEILPALTDAGIRYFVFGGIGNAGIAGKFLRENQDVDVYVEELDFPRVESVLKRLCEKHGGWDADRWALRYSMLRHYKRPKLDIYIKDTERFSVVPVYSVSDAVEYRVMEIVTLSKSALIQESRSVDGYQFFSPPKEILLILFRSLIERYIAHYNKPKPPDENSKHLIDARAVFPKKEVDEYIARFNEKAKLVSDRDASVGR